MVSNKNHLGILENKDAIFDSLAHKMGKIPQPDLYRNLPKDTCTKFQHVWMSRSLKKVHNVRFELRQFEFIFTITIKPYFSKIIT